jgi:hypothetical protein
LLLEGPDLEELLARVREEHGTQARIVSADRLRRGGVGGFFSKQWFELGVEVPDPAAAPALEPALDPALDTVEALLAMADRADSAPSFDAALSAAESPVDTPEQIAAMQRAALTGIPSPAPAPDAADLPDLAAAIAAALAETATPAPPVQPPVEVPVEVPVAVAPRVVEPQATKRATTGTARDNARDKAVAKAREAAKAATAARRVPPAAAPAAAKPAAPKPAAPKATAPAKRTPKTAAKPKSTPRAKRTAPLRVTSRVDSRPARMTLADAVVAMPGRITVVAGALPHAIAVAEQAVARLRLAPSSLYVAGPAEPGRTGRIYGPEHAASLAEELRAGGPVVLAVDAPVDVPDGAAWAASIADALGADAVVAVVDATRRAEDLRRHLTELGTVTAVAVHGTGDVPALDHPILED